MIEACDAGLAAADRLLQAQLSHEHKALWLEWTAGLPARAAYAHARLGHIPAAAGVLERGRAVILSDLLARAGAGAEISAIRNSGLPEIQSATRPGPLAYIAYTEAGGLALLAQPQASGAPAFRVVWLDQLTEAAVMEAARSYSEAYPGASGPDEPRPAVWREAIDTVTRWLWDAVMGPLLAALDTGRVTLIPGGVLGLLPLHAAWHADRAGPGGRRHALDDALITYAPSARAIALAPAGGRSADSILAVADPASLPATAAETRAALRWFSRQRLLNRADTSLADLHAALPGHSVLHFSCHGSAAPLTSPLDSSLHAARDGSLTLRDILATRLPGVRLAVLSACETSIIDMSVPDEALGLPAGFALAGAQGVIGTLWRIGDQAACDLLTRFYEIWQGRGLEPAEALRQAQQEARGAPHAHPVSWAAFQYVGT